MKKPWAIRNKVYQKLERIGWFDKCDCFGICHQPLCEAFYKKNMTTKDGGFYRTI
jgi:hypothetical protein